MYLYHSLPNLQQTFGTFARIARKLQLVFGSMLYEHLGEFLEDWVFLIVMVHTFQDKNGHQQKGILLILKRNVISQFLNESLCIPSLKLTAKPLKMDGWKTIFRFGAGPISSRGFCCQFKGVNLKSWEEVRSSHLLMLMVQTSG